MYLFETVILLLWIYTQNWDLLNHLVVLFLIFLETSILFSIVAELIYIPINSIEGSPFLHILINNCFQLLTIAIPVDWR